MPGAEAFLKAILADPADPGPQLIYSDWLEEHGRADLAFAYRWMGARGQRPGERRRPRLRKPWAWWHPRSAEYEPDPEDRKDIALCPHALLPGLVFEAMIGSYTPHAYYMTWAQAVDALAAGLKVLRALVSLEPPAP
jgi:uncharacterized protein (TIGR02996 family)